MTPRSWELRLLGERPWSLNSESSWSHFKRASTVARWRVRAQTIALYQQIPRLEAARILRAR